MIEGDYIFFVVIELPEELVDEFKEHVYSVGFWEDFDDAWGQIHDFSENHFHSGEEIDKQRSEAWERIELDGDDHKIEIVTPYGSVLMAIRRVDIGSVIMMDSFTEEVD
jgi:hypothetical protein